MAIKDYTHQIVIKESGTIKFTIPVTYEEIYNVKRITNWVLDFNLEYNTSIDFFYDGNYHPFRTKLTPEMVKDFITSVLTLLKRNLNLEDIVNELRLTWST